MPAAGYYYRYDINQIEARKSHHIGFRRLQMRRRTSGGNYEASWVTIPERYVKSWGNIAWDLDNKIVGKYKQSGMNLTLVNVDAFFNDQSDADSFWYGYGNRHRTLVRVQAGYLDSVGSSHEYPSDTTMFMGILRDDIEMKDDHTVSLKVDTLDSIFREMPGDRLSVTALNGGSPYTTLTAERVIAGIRDWTDGSGTFYFRNFITNASWSILSTTANYAGMNTSSSEAFKGISMWDIIEKMAQAENAVAYISPSGVFNFRARTAPTTAAVYRFAGIGAFDRTYGHNIKTIDSYKEAASRIINRVRVIFGEEDTTTSLYLRQQSFSWGDGSTSDVYGVRQYELKNSWIANSATAQTLGDAIFTEYSGIRYEMDLSTKYIPQVFLLDNVQVTYKSPSPPIGPLWGYFLWGANTWNRSQPRGFKTFDQKGFQVIGLKHNLDRMESSWKLRETS